MWPLNPALEPGGGTSDHPALCGNRGEMEGSMVKGLVALLLVTLGATVFQEQVASAGLK